MSPDYPVNLHSDTQTRPTPGMRQAIAAAEVGDEQRGLDPTVNALCARVAELLGTEAAVFLPTGAMCNLIAFRIHAGGAGDAVFLSRTAHPLLYEVASAAVVAGAQLVPLAGEGGMYTAQTLRGALYEVSRHAPRNAAVSVEQTTNVTGGRIWPLAQVRSVLEVAREHGMAAHMDGARLLNAVVASGVPASDWAAGFDSVWIDFTKGLGAPVGAVLAGSAALIEEAYRYKHMLGGAFRQAGIVAAGCLYALDHHVDRLAEDHANAAALAAGLRDAGYAVVEPETNIVVFEAADAPGLVAFMEEAGVEVTALGPTTVRAVTHLDVDAAGIARAIAVAATAPAAVR